MGIFKHQGRTYFQEDFMEDCVCLGHHPGISWMPKSPDPKCKICKGDGEMVVTRLFKEISRLPKKGSRKV